MIFHQKHLVHTNATPKISWMVTEFARFLNKLEKEKDPTIIHERSEISQLALFVRKFGSIKIQNFFLEKNLRLKLSISRLFKHLSFIPRRKLKWQDKFYFLDMTLNPRRLDGVARPPVRHRREPAKQLS